MNRPGRSEYPRFSGLSCLLLGSALFLGVAGTADAARQVGPPCDPAASTQTVSFVHLGDLHARFGASFADKWAKLYRYYEDVRSQNPYTVFTNAGDDYEKGSVAEQLSLGTAVREAVFATGFDVRVLGNHDYAWGELELLPFSRDPKAIVLASNTVYTGSHPADWGAVDYGELQVGCVKVGFFGMVSKPWNEFDTQYTGDFLPNFTQRWDWTTRAREIIAQHRSSVDLLVMVSHLGFGTDQTVAKYTPSPTNSKVSAIDLILGGHNHGGYQFAVVKNTPVIQSEFYADGISRFDITWDIKNRKIKSRSSRPTNVDTTSLTATNTALQQTLRDIVARHAPDSERELGVLQSSRDYVDLAEIAARAGMADFQADAALIDPELTWVSGFSAGPVTQQMFNNLYRVERQRSDTPGFNGLYMATVTGANLSRMKSAQSGWLYVGPAAPVATATYKVLLHKAPALNPLSFFPSGTTLSQVGFQLETWEALDRYARARTANCMYLDTDSTLYSCGPGTPPPEPPPTTTSTTIWNFDNPALPFKADAGVSTIGHRDPATASGTTFASTSQLGLPNLPGGASGVMAFPQTGPGGGYTITHNFAPNGAFGPAPNYLVSNYTLVMDVLWPASSDGKWRALLQTDPTNASDADWFVKNSPSGGIGILGSYFGSLRPGVWYRIAMVVTAQPSGGLLQFYIDGVNVGSKSLADQRFALQSQVLLLADNYFETAPGYLNAMLLSDRAFTGTEIAALGGPSATLTSPSSTALQAKTAVRTTATEKTTAGASDVIVSKPAATSRPDDFDKWGKVGTRPKVNRVTPIRDAGSRR